MTDLAVIILTHNEALHIERAIHSVAGIAREIYVVDSYSTDETRELASRAGATVLSHPFVNYSKQFQWAIDTIETKATWLMRLDADEIVEPDLVANLARFLSTTSSDVVGINIKRKHIFMNRWVRHGGRYPLLLLRIWRRDHGRIEDRWMDEHIVVWGGRTVTVDGGFADHNLNDLVFFTAKHNKYATREAIDVLNQRWNLFPRDLGVEAKATSLQTAVKRWVKERLFNRTPFPVAALAYFIWRYLFQAGFLDGRSGLVYHFLQGYWYRFLVGARVMELEAAIKPLRGDKAATLRELSRLTGHMLADG